MMQSKRKLSNKSTRTHWCSSNNSSQNKYSSFAIKGCFVFAVTIVIYVNFRFAYPAIYYKYGSNGVTNNDVIKKKRDRIKEFQSLPMFPENPKSLSIKSSIQEWEQWTQEPMIGTYRYSTIATIQLPTADLEPKSKSTTKTYDPKLFAKNVRIKAGANNIVDESPKSSVTFLSNDSVILTRKGHKFNPEDGIRTPNQDRVLILSKKAQQDDKNNNDNNNSEDWWIGLFDGHGYHGQHISQYCSLEFARHIHQLWEKDTTTTTTTTKVDTIDTLKRSFLEINRSIPPFIASSGSTGISVLRRGNSLYISNVGDSMAFVASYNKNNNDSIKIIYTTQPHKPDSPKERERIENAGGHVQDSPFEGASARLIIPILGGDNGIDSSVGLAMSRSLGDHDGENVGLTAEPDTDVLDLSQFDKNKEYIVVAVTDGLVDFGRLSAEEVALSMSKAFSSSSSPSSLINNNNNNKQRGRKQKNNLRRSLLTPTAEAAAAKLILKASQLWIRDPDESGYRDDISIVAHKLRI